MLLHPLRSYTGVLALLLVAACGPVDVHREVANLRVHLPSSAACAPPSAIDSIAVQALGDFPASDQTIELIATDLIRATVDRFPPNTEALSFEASVGATWRAGAVRDTEGRDELMDLLLLPYEESCSVGDPELRAPPASGVVALPGGGLLIVGGSEDALGSRRLVRLPPGRELSELVGDGIQLRREGATVTAAGELIVVAGGAAGTTGVAHDTFEVLRNDDAVTVEGLHPLCPASASTCTGRRNHGATLLPDGRVLLVGGIAETGSAPLDSAEILDPESGAIDLDIAALSLAKEHPQAVTLDDGTVLVIGGRGTGGGFTGTVFWFDMDAREFVQIGEGNELVPREGAIAISLPGARVAWVYNEVGANAGLAVQVLARSGAYLPGLPIFRRVDTSFADRVPTLSTLRAVALSDGRLLVTGKDDSERPRAFVLDLGTEDVHETNASRAPTALVPLDDGTIAELDADGASLRREVLLSALDNPSATLLAGSSVGVAFDAAAHWEAAGADFRARVEGARIDVPLLEFADFSAELEATGDAELLLLARGREPASVLVREGTAGPALCETERLGDAPLHITRTGNQLRVSAGGTERTCTLPALPTRVGLAVRASNRTLIRALRIARL